MKLELKKINKSFGGVKPLQECSFTISKGNITAIIGPNGSGKTTCFNIISRLVQEDSGTIAFDNQNITGAKDYEVAKLGISRTFQEVRLFNNLTIRDHIAIALLEDDEKLFSSFFKKKIFSDKKIQSFLDLVHLKKSLDTFATDLSYGQRKLLDLAIAIAKPHSLLMLDEPVAGVNPVLRKEIKEIIRSLHKKGETILIIEHDMNFVMDLAGYIIVMDAGFVIAKGKPEEIQNNQEVLNAYLGE